MNVMVLPSRFEMDARANLRALVARAKARQVFGPTVDFDAAVWDLAPVKSARPTASSANAMRLYFTSAENGTAKGLEGRSPWAPDFANVMKAIIVLRGHAQPKGVNDYRAIVYAARALHDVLRNRNHDPVELVSGDFIKAGELFRASKSPHTQYLLGNRLVQIAEAINRYRIGKVRIVFANPFGRVNYDNRQVDEEARARVAQKMASDEAVDAIVTMCLAVREAGDDRDILYAAIVELLMCAPWRINDALNLLVDCERREPAPETAAVEGGQAERLGIAYRGSKGVKAAIKWIPSAMVPIAERALADIRRITAAARKVARFMEEHPGRAWLPKPRRLADPESRLTSADLRVILGQSCVEVAVRWAKDHKVKVVGRRASQGLYRLGDLEDAILRMQPRLPPGSPRLSQYLFLIPRWFSRDTGSMMPVVTFVTDSRVSDFMVGRGPGRSVFERLDIRDAGGNAYAVRSHELRHFLNNAAQEGHLSQLDIARWSGRKQAGENSTYDHTGGIPLARSLREMLKTDAMRGTIADTFEKLPAVERESFLRSRLATVHMTDIGACVQDWSLAPCPNHGSCAGCGDHLVVKGDAKQRERAERMLKDYEPMVAAAEDEVREGTYGAGPWVEHNRKIGLCT